ncbi:MAG: putative quinol monooxygenase [Pseudomonadota bacterium]
MTVIGGAMIIIWGSVNTTHENRDAALALSHEHVRRSREEPGCLSHGAYVDSEDPNRIVFFEQWQDMDAVQVHFKVPASGAFVAALGKLATAPPTLELYDATPLTRVS